MGREMDRERGEYGPLMPCVDRGACRLGNEPVPPCCLFHPVRLLTHSRQVAAYKNKVMNWRARIETDIGEVLQVQTVFQNVSKASGAGVEREGMGVCVCGGLWQARRRHFGT